MKEKRFMENLREVDHPRRKNDYAKEEVLMSKLVKEENEFSHQYYYDDPIPLTGRKI